ncbi:MAG: hypothetical protein FWC92_09530 [Defluviitaleaceae bacterium]|nr:hypothetical protein [Defluviitaleaceae bacterium]
MDKGCLIEEGTHDELVAKNGKYAQMWQAKLPGTLFRIGSNPAAALVINIPTPPAPTIPRDSVSQARTI